MSDTRHRRVKSARGPARNYLCEGGCQRKAAQWATIHGKSGDDVADYVPLCYKCHGEYDQKGIPMSPEARTKMSAAHLGKPLSPAHRAAIGAANLGTKRGPYKMRTA